MNKRCILCNDGFRTMFPEYEECDNCNYLRNGIKRNSFIQTCKKINLYRIRKNKRKCSTRRSVSHPLCRNKSCVALKRNWPKFKYRMKKIGGDLTNDEWIEILDKPCTYCGFCGSNGIDRKTSSLGYTPKNSVPSCMYCNIIKKDMSYTTFMKKVKKIADFN